MGLLSEAIDLQAAKPGGGRRCGLCLESNPDTTTLVPSSDAIELAEVLANKNIAAPTIVAVLRDRGVETKTGNVQNHRREHVASWTASAK